MFGREVVQGFVQGWTKKVKMTNDWESWWAWREVERVRSGEGFLE